MTSSGVPERLLLDCCSLLNLYATNRIGDILAPFAAPTVVARVVQATEALWVGSGPRDDPGADYEVVDLEPLVQAGVLRIEEPESDEELALFVEFAVQLGDGEAMSGALAATRAYTIVTDDGAAIRVFSTSSPPVRTRSTASVVKQWAEAESLSVPELSETLQTIERRASFHPPRRDPLRSWWRSTVDQRT